jgi:hypothetical protein
MENREIKTVEDNKIVFFLGAGASVPADVPDTMGFIYEKEGFKEHIKDEGSEEEQSPLQEILTVLEGRKEEINKKYELFTRKTNNNEKSEKFEGIKREKEKFEKIDVELVLETLYKLNNRAVGVLPDFYDEATFKIKGKEESLKSLEKELRRFIREKTIVGEEKIGYLAPLKEFVAEYEMLDIFSVNYDTCVEQFSKEYGLRYTDGFELYWHPELFDDRDYDIKLYKIHGSVMWYLTDRGTYVKIPIASKEKDEIELITGETAKTLMVYPMSGKWEYAEPLLELLRKLHERLEIANVCIVVGYSFRDDYIRRIFFEAARKNKDLTIFLIDPDAGRIYDDKLQFINKDKGIPSSLEGRVICWNYPMENALGDYYLYQSLKTLVDIQTLIREADKIGREGKGAYGLGLKECVSKCIDIGYTSMAEKILEIELGVTVDNLKGSRLFLEDERNGVFKVLCGLGVNHLSSGHYDKAKKYFEELKNILNEYLEKGNRYFALSYQSSKLENNPGLLNEEDKVTLARLRQNIEHIKEDREALSLSEWFINSGNSRWVIRLQSGFIDVLNREIGLRSREDLSYDPRIEQLKVLLEKCTAMKELLKVPRGSVTFKDSEIFNLAGSQGSCIVETRRKTDAEKKLTEIQKALEALITFCEVDEYKSSDR